MADIDAGARKPPNPALSFLTGFAPWIAYFAMVGNVPFVVAVLTALGLAVVVVVVAVARHRTPKVLEIGTVVVFACFTALALTADQSFLERWLQPLSNGGLLAIVVVSIAIGRPFTLQYAQEQTPPELWEEPGFLYVNRIIARVWAGALAIGAAVSSIPPIVDGDATLTDADDALSIVCYWVIPFSALALAMVFTVHFPDWFVAAAGGDDDAPPAPAPQPADPLPTDRSGDVAHTGALTLDVDPADVDATGWPTLRVSGVAAGAAVQIAAETVDAVGHRWRSEASVVADGDGTVDLGRDAPSSGDWSGTDPTAPMWSMRFASSDAEPDLYLPPLDPTAVVVSAEVEGSRLHRTVVRHLHPGDVQIRQVAAPLLAGRLFLPAEPSRPGVVLVPGSEGGVESMSSDAAILAAAGHPALVAATFRGDGPALTDDLPDQLQRVPLERIAAAVRWLADHGTTSGAVRLVGISRGAEAVLATLAADPDLPVDRAVVISPSAVTWVGLGPQGSTPGIPAWTWQGEDLPALEPDDDAVLAEMARTALRRRGRSAGAHPDLLHLVRAHGPALDTPAAAGCAIAVEDVRVPLLLLAGEADAVWPSVRMAHAIVERRSGANLGLDDEVVTHPDAGHLLRLGLWPTTVPWTGGIALGGTAPGLAAAQADGTERVLGFLGR